MTDKELKEIRQKISCPQLGDECYGEWGILTKDQRFTIKRMLDFIAAQEEEIKRLQKIQEPNGGAECPICHGTGRIRTTNWLTKDMTEEQLAKAKEKAIFEYNAMRGERDAR